MKRGEISGFTLTEVVISLAMASTMLVAVVQAMVSLGRTQLAGQERTLAVLEAANLMEIIQARSWDQVTAEKTGDVKLSDDFQRAVPQARLSVTVTSVADPVVGKRIAIAITRSDAGNRSLRLASLTAWRFLDQGEAE